MKNLLIIAMLGTLPLAAKPAPAAKTPPPPAQPIAETPAAPIQQDEVEKPAQKYKTFVIGFLFGAEVSQVKYTYDYSGQTGPGSPYYTFTGTKTLTVYGPMLGLSAYITPAQLFHINVGAKGAPVRGTDSSLSGKDLLGVAVTPFLNLGLRLGRLGPLGLIAPYVGATYTKYIGVLNFDKSRDLSFISAVGGLEFMEERTVFGLSYEHRLVALDSTIRDLSSWRASLYFTFLFGG